MRAAYEPSESDGEGASITIGLGDLSEETFVLRQGEEPKDVPAAFTAAVVAHSDIQVIEA